MSDHGEDKGSGGGHHHGHERKFDPANLERLRDPERVKAQDPEKIWSVLADGAVRSVVDIGAGIGFFSIPFARHMPEGRVYACDILPEMLEHLQKELEKEHVANVQPVLSEEVRIPLEDGIADVVFMANLHHELDHPDQTLAECHRLLKPGGKVVIIDWKPEGTPHGPPVEIRIPVPTVRGHLTAAGYHEIKEHPILPHHYFLTAVK